MTAYSNPELTQEYMQRLDDNMPKIIELRNIMKQPNHDFVDRVIAFTEMYNLYDGDPYRQRRLVGELKFEAQKEQNNILQKEAA